MIDINDAMKAGFTLAQIRASAKPTDTNDILAKRGMLILKRCVNTILAEEDRTQRQILLRRMMAEYTVPLTAAWRFQEHKFHAEIMMLNSLTGLSTTLREVISALKRATKECKIAEKELRREQLLQSKVTGKDQPQDAVLDRMDRKPIKENGEIVGWGEPKKVIHNLDAILRYDTRKKDKLRYNEFSGCCEYEGKALEDHVVDKLRMWVSKTYYGLDLGNTDTGRCMDIIGRENTYHPIREMLEALDMWDKKPRAASLFIKYWGARDCKINRMYASCALLASVVRVYKKGAKYDTAPLLIGPTGAGKGKGIEILCMDSNYYSDTHLDLGSKDCYGQIQGIWLYELSEAEAVFDKAGFSRAKAFLSSKEDWYRAPYRSFPTRVPRQVSFWETSNRNDLDFLADPTSSRRYHPIQVQKLQEELLKDNVEQIWAEVMALYDKTHPYHDLAREVNGMSAFPNDPQWWLDDDHEKLRKEAVHDFRSCDQWEIIFLKYLEMKRNHQSSFDFYPKDLLTSKECLDISPGRISPKDMRRATDCLLRIKCKPTGERVYIQGRRVRMWRYKGEVKKNFDT